MKLSDYVADFLLLQGVNRGYFMIGGALGHIADSCHRKGIELVTMHHEQAAAFAAEGQAIVSSNIGFAMATSGPGATNLVTGIGSAYFASLPVLYITGQVNTTESNQSGKRRQVGFQETDIVSMIDTVTKYSVQVRDPDTIAYHLEKACFMARHGRKGPVLIDLPFNVQGADIDLKKIKHFIGSKEHSVLSETIRPASSAVSKVTALISAARRPLILVGHGIKLSQAEEELSRLVERTGIPVVSSLMATDVFPNDNPLYFGFIGTYGQRYSNFAVANCDLLLVLGSRLDSRQVGVKSKFFAPMAKLVHVDIDPNELNASVSEAISVEADVKVFLHDLLPALASTNDLSEWLSYLAWLKDSYPEVVQKTEGNQIDPVFALRTLSLKSGRCSFVAVDVGSNQMWFAQAWSVQKGQTVSTNGGMGPMGYSLPAAIGASVSASGAMALAITGDGGLQINIQELQTIKRRNLPIKIIVLNNNCLGMLTQFQTENFEGRLIGSVEGYDAPDFMKVAQAYGIPSLRTSDKKSLGKDMDWLLSQEGPGLLEVVIPRNFWVLPKSVYSRPVFDMKPFLERAELERALKYVDQKKIKELEKEK